MNRTINLSILHGSWEIITIPIGCYELEDINVELQRQILLKKGSKDAVKLEPNFNTLKCIMTLSKGVKVDMTLKNSLRSVLGFESKVYNEGRHESENLLIL